jgi:DNA-directed RNA polymerase subunit delta
MPAHTILQSRESDVEESWDEEDRELGTDEEEIDLDEFDDIDDEDEDEI